MAQNQHDIVFTGAYVFSSSRPRGNHPPPKIPTSTTNSTSKSNSVLTHPQSFTPRLSTVFHPYLPATPLHPDLPQPSTTVPAYLMQSSPKSSSYPVSVLPFIRRSSMATTSLASTPLGLDSQATVVASSPSSSMETLARPRDPFNLGTWVLFLCHLGLALCLFLATTDGAIVSTSLPTISADLPGSDSLYSWVGTSYLLAQTLVQPLFGQVTNIFGLKRVLYASVMVFLGASIGCGSSTSMLMLVLFRGLQGAGGGGIVSTVWTVMSKLVWPEERSRWQGFLSITWGLSAVAGPVLGGLFSDKVSWRWCFWINGPIGAVALALVAYALLNINVDEGQNKDLASFDTWKGAWREFDMLGLSLIMLGTVCLLLGFTFSSELGWRRPSTIALIASGAVLLILAILYEAFYANHGVIPSEFFKDPTIGIVMLTSFLQTFAWTAVTFYLVMYYQAATGEDALTAGLLMLPIALVSAILSWPVSTFVTPRISLKWLVLFGYGLGSLGFGTMSILNHHTPFALQEVLPAVVGIGYAFLLKLPNEILSVALQDKHLASANGNFFLVRFIGCTTGLSIASAMFTNQVTSRLEDIYELDPSNVDWRMLGDIMPLELRETVLSAVSESLSTIWILCAALMGFSCLLCFLIPTKQFSPMRPGKDTEVKPELEVSPASTIELKNSSVENVV